VRRSGILSPDGESVIVTADGRKFIYYLTSLTDLSAAPISGLPPRASVPVTEFLPTGTRIDGFHHTNNGKLLYEADIDYPDINAPGEFVSRRTVLEYTTSTSTSKQIGYMIEGPISRQLVDISTDGRLLVLLDGDGQIYVFDRDSDGNGILDDTVDNSAAGASGTTYGDAADSGSSAVWKVPIDLSDNYQLMRGTVQLGDDDTTIVVSYQDRSRGPGGCTTPMENYTIVLTVADVSTEQIIKTIGVTKEPRKDSIGRSCKTLSPISSFQSDNVYFHKTGTFQTLPVLFRLAL